MNGTQIKCFLVMGVLAIIGFGPLSLTCLIGMGVVIMRPLWFRAVVENLYRNAASGPADDPVGQPSTAFETAAARIKCFLSLVVLLVLDIAPVPVTGSIGLYVVIMRPRWFKNLVETIYGGVRVGPKRDGDDS